MKFKSLKFLRKERPEVQSSGLRVRSLVWEKAPIDSLEAHSIVGRYKISLASDGGWYSKFGRLRLEDQDGRANFLTLEEAKDAAQQHFNRLILNEVIKDPREDYDD